MNEEKNINLKIIPPREYLPQIAAVLAAVLILFLAVLIISQAVIINNKIKEGRYLGNQNTIAVSGEGKALAQPDIGQVNLTVLTPKATVALAQAENTKKMNAIVEEVKSLGVKEEDLKTINYQISPAYRYLDGKSTIIGYEVRQTLQIKIRDLSKTSEILDKAVALGANEVGSLNFIIDDEEKLKEEARAKAIESAKKKAETLAKTLGVKLGKITSFYETSDGTPYPPLYYSAEKLGLGIGGGGETPQIQTGQNEIYVYVTLNYEIH